VHFVSDLYLKDYSIPLHHSIKMIIYLSQNGLELAFHHFHKKKVTFEKHLKIFINIAEIFI